MEEGQLQQAWESQGSRKLRKQSKGRSRSSNSCSERREQRQPLCLPPQPQGIEADAPENLCHPVKEGGAPSKAEVGFAERKTPQTHTLSCAGGDYGAAPGQSKNHRLRKVRCPLDNAAFTDTEDTSSSNTNPRSESTNNTARKTTSW